MNLELFFIYDSQCPWSYAALPLVNAIKQAFPDTTVNTIHCAHYHGGDTIGVDKINRIKLESKVRFSAEYMQHITEPKNSIISANLMAWLELKQPHVALDVLNALEHAHFIDGNPLTCAEDFSDIIAQFKLSPATKLFKNKLTKDAEFVVEDLYEMQQHIGTSSFPALLLVVGEKAVLLDHSQYLDCPQEIVAAVKQQF